MPKVSIITPNYNSESFISETIQSVVNQTFTDWEWLICDDGSTDNSVKIIENAKDERIQLIQNPKNLGVAESRNNALDRASGRFITFLDSDDLWEPNFLEYMVHYLIQNDEALAYTSYKRVDENLKPKLKDFQAIDKVDYQRILYNCPIPMLTAMYDSDKIGKIAIPLVEKREDHAMWIEILKKTTHARGISQSLGIYRIRKNSYSRNKFRIAKHQFLLYYNYLKLPLPKSLFYTFTWGINGIFKYK